MALKDDYRATLAAYVKPRGQQPAMPDPSLSRELDELEVALAHSPPAGRTLGHVTVDEAADDQLRAMDGVRPMRDFRVLPVDEWLGRQQTVRPFVWTTLDQDGVGSCAAEAITGAVMALQNWAGQPRVELNPWFLYQETSGGRDRGSSLSTNLAKAKTDGIAPMSVWPRSRGWRAKPSHEATEAARRYRVREVVEIHDWEDFGTALALGIPVYFGYSGHAIWAGELIDTERFRYKNSWGDSWGDEGWGTLHRNRIEWSYAVWGIVSVTLDGADVPAPKDS